MPLIRRGRRLLPLQFPRLDGTSWPDRRDVGRTTFAANTLHQLGYREAFTHESHDITDLLLDKILPMLRPEAAPEDEPYLRRVFSSSAQIGAGIGLVERRVVQDDELSTDRQAAGALWVAAEELPPMPAHQQAIALYMMHCGYYLARTDLTRVPLLMAALAGEDDSGLAPGT